MVVVIGNPPYYMSPCPSIQAVYDSSLDMMIRMRCPFRVHDASVENTCQARFKRTNHTS